MKLEYLYPELGNLFGDSGNMRYLRKSIPEADYVETHLGTQPAFVEDADVKFVYCGPMSERGQRIALDALENYGTALSDRFNDCCFLFTGNSFELTGRRIETADGSVQALGLFPFYSKLDTAHRYNSLFLGKHGDLDICAFNSRFSHSFPEGEFEPFASALRGNGMHQNSTSEGVCCGGFIGTYLLGPILVMNPLLTQQIMERMGLQNREPAFLEDAMAAYRKRLTEFEDPNRKLD